MKKPRLGPRTDAASQASVPRSPVGVPVDVPRPPVEGPRPTRAEVRSAKDLQPLPQLAVTPMAPVPKPPMLLPTAKARPISLAELRATMRPPPPSSSSSTAVEGFSKAVRRVMVAEGTIPQVPAPPKSTRVHPKDQPPKAKVTPPQAPPGVEIDWNDASHVHAEKYFAFMYGKAFHERGPPGPTDGGPTEWRNQKWRDRGERWGNNGGRFKAFWGAFHSPANKALPYPVRRATAVRAAQAAGEGYPEERPPR